MKWSEMNSHERDALIAEKVMDWRPYMLADDDIMEGYFYNGLTSWPVAPPSFTTDISSAWMVVNKMRSHGYPWHMGDNIHGEIDVYFGRVYHGRSTSAPEAICVAALKALRIEVS